LNKDEILPSNFSCVDEDVVESLSFTVFPKNAGISFLLPILNITSTVASSFTDG
jgi:hypothetical protein